MITKIIDCFPYFNEREILELRLRLLYDHVDKFIITDADHTHRGQPKDFSCRDVIRDMGLPMDKIQIIHVQLPDRDQTKNHWVREALQRDAAVQLFESDAVHIVSDCDEIINPKLIPMFAQACQSYPKNIIRIPLDWMNGRANLRVHYLSGKPASWNTPFVCTSDHVKKYSLSQIRNSYATGEPLPEFLDLMPLDKDMEPITSGWHFSWMGDHTRMKIKATSYAHADDTRDYCFQNAIADLNSDTMLTYLESYQPHPGDHDAYGRTEHVLHEYPLESLPEIIFQYPVIQNFLFQTTETTNDSINKLTNKDYS